MNAIIVLALITVVTCSTSIVLAQTNEKAISLSGRCVLAESISAEFKGSANKNFLNEESVQAVLKTKSSKEITADLINYANIFEAWAKRPPVSTAKENTTSVSPSTNDDRRAMFVQVFKREFGKTGPIDGYGGIIRVEMLEMAARHYTNAMPYLKRIAEVELPKALGVPTCARVESQYQDPAAGAWVKLSMPEGLANDQKKAWLDNFIANEKGQGKDGKKWAIEAAERMLRKIDKTESIPAGTSNETKNVRSE